ncbi:hypothetical protein F4804DRAFT_87332 [Jackrogersella minutella]|nr:hypothetical protein F4804DRAFT_87332 [Jackrogersella minutella]
MSSFGAYGSGKPSYEALEQMVAQLQHQCNCLHQEKNAVYHEASKEIAALRQEVATQQEALEQLGYWDIAVDSDEPTLESRYARLEEHSDALFEETKELQAEVNEQDARILALEEESQEFLEQNVKLQAELAEEKSTVEKLEQEHRGMQQEHREMQQEYRERYQEACEKAHKDYRDEYEQKLARAELELSERVLARNLRPLTPVTPPSSPPSPSPFASATPSSPSPSPLPLVPSSSDALSEKRGGVNMKYYNSMEDALAAAQQAHNRVREAAVATFENHQLREEINELRDVWGSKRRQQRLVRKRDEQAKSLGKSARLPSRR